MDNTALTIAIINSSGLVVVAVIGLIGIFISGRNARKLIEVSKAVNGLTTARIEAETNLGEAKAEIARHEGADAARKEGVQIAKDLLYAAPSIAAAAQDVSIVESVVLPVDVKGKSKP